MTVTIVDLLTVPELAVKFADCEVVAGPAVAVKETAAAPDGTVMVEGTETTLLLDDTDTDAIVVPGLASANVHAKLLAGATLLGQEILDSAAGAAGAAALITMVAVRFTWLRLAVTVTDWVCDEDPVGALKLAVTDPALTVTVPGTGNNG